MLKTLKKVLSIHELFLVIYATLYEHFIKQKFGPKYKVYFNMETEGAKLISDILSFTS